MLMRLAARPVNVYSVCLLLLAVAWSISPARRGVTAAGRHGNGNR